MKLSQGRIGRLEYFTGWCFLWLALLLMVGFAELFGAVHLQIVPAVIMAISLIAFIVYSFILRVDRLHDLDQSGWFLLLGFIPLVGLIIHIWLLSGLGSQGPNAYGTQPPKKVFLWTQFQAMQRDRRARLQALTGFLPPSK